MDSLPNFLTHGAPLRARQARESSATNDFLLKIGKKETDSCSFCADSPETLFWDCRSTQTFWNNVSQWISENLDLTNLTPFSPALCLGLIDSISHLFLHHFLLIARHTIYIYIYIYLQTKKYMSHATNVHPASYVLRGN